MTRERIKLVSAIPLGFAVIMSFGGCLVPPIFFPKTSVHGVVVDQDNNPVPNVNIEALSNPPRLIIWATPEVYHYIKSDKKGHWSYSEHKVGWLFIEAMPPAGYKAYWRPGDERIRTRVGSFSDGDCPTNDFILRLEKLPEPGAGAK